MNLDLSYNQLTEIKSRNFLPKAGNLQNLGLQHNKISNIEPGSFSHLHGLEMLDLSGNELNEIGHKAFYGLVNCNQLTLSNNQIR